MSWINLNIKKRKCCVLGESEYHDDSDIIDIFYVPAIRNCASLLSFFLFHRQISQDLGQSCGFDSGRGV